MPDAMTEAQRATDLAEHHRAINLMVVQRVFPEGNVEVWCDRCGECVHGYWWREATSGFYCLLPDAPREYPWASFFSPDEVIICDACMWDDPRYQEAYGVHHFLTHGILRHT